MVKNSKRKQDIKSKLIAAIAMLMVATIMMVSSTYAWFTLSTAPEVQGISTNVGSNGNLEIALSPDTGDEADVEDAMNANTMDWVEKNLTWGNQLNLSDPSYGLGGINLFPASLNSNDLGSTPLSTPVYGADGRVDKLEANTMIGSKADNGWIVGAENPYGVRVVGTSSSMTEYQVAFNQQYSTLGTSYKGAHDKAQAGLNANGAALAEMAIKHANADGTDTNNYKTYVPALTALIASLTEANNDLEQAIKSAIYAIGSSNLLLYDPDTVADPAAPTEEELEALAAMHNTIKELVENNTLDVIWENAALQGALAGIEAVYPLNLDEAYDIWEANTEKLTTATATLTTISAYPEDQTVYWADDGETKGVSSVVAILMDTNDNLKINGYALSTFKEKAYAALDPEPDVNDTTKYPNGADDDAYKADKKAWDDAVEFVSDLASGGGINLEMGNGTGIYADLASLVGDIHATVEDVEVSIPVGDNKTLNVKPDVALDTTTGSNPVLGGVRTTLGTIGYLNIDSSADQVIDNAYGYIVDFLFRTNATGSNLLLQTEAKDRIYGEDGNNENTMGGGSTMTFTSDVLSEQSVKGLMKALRVVFFDTQDGTLYGVAKLDEATFTSVTTGEGDDAVTEITAELYLYEGDVKTSNVLCSLPTNTAKAVSALVYLNGANITNADVAAEAQSMTGTMNLQFASDATLTPMENSALMNGEGATETETQP